MGARGAPRRADDDANWPSVAVVAAHPGFGSAPGDRLSANDDCDASPLLDVVSLWSVSCNENKATFGLWARRKLQELEDPTMLRPPH